MSTIQNNEPNASSPVIIDNVEDCWIPKIKRRRRFTMDETRVLENEFEKNSSPNQDKIQHIANMILTPRKIVTTWFQNRRAKNKRKEKLRREESATTERKNSDPEYKDYTLSRSSNLTDDESNSEDEDYYQNNSENGSGSDYDDINHDHDNDQHNCYSVAQQQLSTPSENSNLQVDLDDTLVTQSLHAINSYVLTNFDQSNAVNPSTLHLPYDQHYNINIYNLMNNHFLSQEHIYGNSNEALVMRQNNSISHQHVLNMFNYQQQLAPFFMNNINFPSQSTSPSENNSICINPTDLYLNYFPQNRHQRHQEQQHQLQLREEFNEDSE